MRRVVIICDIPDTELLNELDQQLHTRWPQFRRCSPAVFEGEVTEKHSYHDLVDFFDYELRFSKPLPAGSQILRVDGEDLRITPCGCGRTEAQGDNLA